MIRSLLEEVRADAQAAYDAREAEFGAETMRQLERRVVLMVRMRAGFGSIRENAGRRLHGVAVV